MIRARDPGYPILKSKAAQARHVLPFARHLAHRHAEDAARGAYSFPARHRLAGREAEYLANVVPLLDNAVDFYEACNDRNYRPDMARDCMYNVLNHLEALSALFADGCPLAQRAKQPFHVRPKMHMMQEIAHPVHPRSPPIHPLPKLQKQY